MAGLMSSSVGMIICAAENPSRLDVEALRAASFSDVVDPDGIKSGWVGLGDLLDTDNFFLATCDSRYQGFSWRMDARRPSAAVVRLQLEEKLRAEKAKGVKVSAKRKKEMREEITARLLAACEFIPSLTDCVWDSEKGRLFILSNSEKMVERICAAFLGAFKIDAAPIVPEMEMTEVYGQIQQANGSQLPGWRVQPLGSANLRSAPDDAETSSVAVQNNPDAVNEALGKGLAIKRISLVAESAENADLELRFSINDDLRISGLRLPRAEKGAEEEAVFIVNASICGDAADIAQEISTAR